MTISGESAELHWQYHRAATLSRWTVVPSDGAWTFTASIVAADQYRVSQRPLTIVTPNGWRWPVHTLQITDQTLTASIGPKE